MALFRRLFYRKPPDRILEICERVYVFDCCFSSDVLEEDEYKVYLGGIAVQLQDHFPDASFMTFNFREGNQRTPISDILSQYDMTVMSYYPLQYEGCPVLPMETIHHFLRSSESWLSLEGQQNVLLMHCERGGWPLLAFMLAGLLLYLKKYEGEQKTLKMICKQAPAELLHLSSPLNPHPSQLRYLQYISRRNLGSDWPPPDTPLILDFLVLRFLPVFKGEKYCRPVVHVYGKDPSEPANKTSKLLFSTSKTKHHARRYGLQLQEECTVVKIDIQCCVEGDVVLECIHLGEDLVHEEMMFRVMFHTAFVRSNILMVNSDEVDTLWDAKDLFSKDFRAEVLFSDADVVFPKLDNVLEIEDQNNAESASPEDFFEVEEIFMNVNGAQESKEEHGPHIVHDFPPVDVDHNETLIGNAGLPPPPLPPPPPFSPTIKKASKSPPPPHPPPPFSSTVKKASKSPPPPPPPPPFSSTVKKASKSPPPPPPQPPFSSTVKVVSTSSQHTPPPAPVQLVSRNDPPLLPLPLPPPLPPSLPSPFISTSIASTSRSGDAGIPSPLPAHSIGTSITSKKSELKLLQSKKSTDCGIHFHKAHQHKKALSYFSP